MTYTRSMIISDPADTDTDAKTSSTSTDAGADFGPASEEEDGVNRYVTACPYYNSEISSLIIHLIYLARLSLFPLQLQREWLCPPPTTHWQARMMSRFRATMLDPSSTLCGTQKHNNTWIPASRDTAVDHNRLNGR
jgi:hypothetical protein